MSGEYKQETNTHPAAVSLGGVKANPATSLGFQPECLVKIPPSTFVASPPESESPPPEEDDASVVALPPSDQESEEATLGSVLTDPACFPELAAILKPVDFQILRHGWIWQAFENLVERGEPLDFLTIPRELTRMGRFDDIGGDSFLTALLNRCPSSLHATTYAGKVKDCAIKRRMLAVANEIANLAYNPRITAEQVCSRAIEAVQENTGSPRTRYVVHDAADALAPRASVEWIVKGLIYEKSITVLYGDGGSKKTWSTMFLAACVSSGVAWGDFETRKGRVLFVDEENGHDEIAERAGRCLRGALADETAELFYISLAAFHLDNPQDEALLTAEILRQGADLVAMDALADLMEGDENSKQDTQPVFNALRRISEKTGAAILIIHHANKNGGHRGSSVIKDAPDVLLQVSSDPESNYINFKTEKNRKGKAQKWAMRATWSQDSFYLTGAETLEKIKALSKSQEYVLRYLTEHGASPLPAIMAAADTCSSEAARKAAYNLAGLKRIYRTNPGVIGQGATAIYDLVKPDNE